MGFRKVSTAISAGSVLLASCYYLLSFQRSLQEKMAILFFLSRGFTHVFFFSALFSRRPQIYLGLGFASFLYWFWNYPPFATSTFPFPNLQELYLCLVIAFTGLWIVNELKPFYRDTPLDS